MPIKDGLKTLIHFKLFRFFTQSRAKPTTLTTAMPNCIFRKWSLRKSTLYGSVVMGPIRYALGKWPVKFKRDEMGAAALFCAGNDNAVLDGPDRTEALGKLAFIGDFVVDVDTVAVIVENRSGTNMPYVVFVMNDSVHLCSCRTLQILGLCCRHFWMAMRLSCKFRFHIGILNQHWLVEQGRRPMTDWPATVAPEVGDSEKPRCYYGGRGCHQRGAGCADWRPGG
ncbi:unnamed protein product [Ascophyllum nodosum]